MPSRKRAREEMEVEEPVEEPSTLHKLRNMWQFANLAQYIHLFSDAIKMDKDLDIEELETECLKPHPSDRLSAIGLALLKHVSSHKGLTPEIFDEYTRRQFVAKAPERNPFGTEETPNNFDDFDVFTKIKVLQQLSVWTLNNPNTIRERMNATDSEQAIWRIEPFGWDSEDRTLFVLDDNRLYRRTDPPPPPPPSKKSKAKSKKSRATRSNKRRKQSTPDHEDAVEEEDVARSRGAEEGEDDGLGGMKWECVCVTLEDYQQYMSSIRRSRDANEKILYKRLEDDVLPELAKVAEEQARKQARKMKELETMQKLAFAKRSSRISARVEKKKAIEEEEEAKRRKEEELVAARAEQERQRKLELDHESRRQTREQRAREREAAKILKEEELRDLEAKEQEKEKAGARLSERHLKEEVQKRKKELEILRESNEEGDWTFDCEKCGLYGSKLDDGSLIMSCDKCNVWQHAECHNIPEKQLETYEFVCSSCKRKEEEAKQPKLPPLKLRLTSASPATRNGTTVDATEPDQSIRDSISVQGRVQNAAAPPACSQRTQPWADGPSLSPRGQARGPPGIQRFEAAYSPSLNQTNGSSSPSRPRPYSPAQSGVANGALNSSPPQYRATASSFPSYSLSQPPQTGSPFGPSQLFRSAHDLSRGGSFSRPASSAGGGSPVKHSPAPSPRPSNGVPNGYNFTNSPHSSFPPSSAQQTSFSPTKQRFSSPPLVASQLSSPAPAPLHIDPSPSSSQMPAQMLPDPIPAPSKHDGARPISSQSTSEKPIFPPVQSLSPDTKPQILSPPVKKTSPTPERHRLDLESLTENGNNPGAF